MKTREEVLASIKQWPTNIDDVNAPDGWSWSQTDRRYLPKLVCNAHPDQIIICDTWSIHHGVTSFKRVGNMLEPDTATAKQPEPREMVLEHVYGFYNIFPKNLTDAEIYTFPTGWRWCLYTDGEPYLHTENPDVMDIDMREFCKYIRRERSKLIKAHEFLERGAQHMRDRAVQRDASDGERSMRRAVEAFNAQEGTNLTEAQGWRFMIQLKYARAVNGVFVADDYEDMAAYAGLAGESAQ